MTQQIQKKNVTTYHLWKWDQITNIFHDVSYAWCVCVCVCVCVFLCVCVCVCVCCVCVCVCSEQTTGLIMSRASITTEFLIIQYWKQVILSCPLSLSLSLISLSLISLSLSLSLSIYHFHSSSHSNFFLPLFFFNFCFIGGGNFPSFFSSFRFSDLPGRPFCCCFYLPQLF